MIAKHIKYLYYDWFQYKIGVTTSARGKVWQGFRSVKIVNWGVVYRWFDPEINQTVDGWIITLDSGWHSD